MKNKWLSVLFKKIAAFFISIWVLSAIVFFLSRITPIDPLQSYYGERVEKMSEEQKDSARERLGLNDPIPVQYVRWLKLALSGDFGISYKYKQDVTIVIKERIQNTLVLGVLSYVILFIGALLLGLLCAWNENKFADRFIVLPWNDYKLHSGILDGTNVDFCVQRIAWLVPGKRCIFNWRRQLN